VTTEENPMTEPGHQDQWSRDRLREAAEADRRHDLERSTRDAAPHGWLAPDAWQQNARAHAFRTNDDMEEVDRLFRTDRARYSALPTPVRMAHAMYVDFRTAAKTTGGNQ
jgi:hypothetical protein